MQRYSCLAGAGTAAHNEDAARRVADDLVLLALDGLHDRLHVACAGRIHRAQQSCFAADVGGAGCCVGVVAGEDFIVDSFDRAAAHADIAAFFDAFRMRRRRQVIRASHGCAPVEQESAVVVRAVIDAHAPDIATVQVASAGDGVFGVVVGNVDASEDEAGFRDIEIVELRVERVVLGFAAHESVRVRVIRVDGALDFLQPSAGRGDFTVQMREERVHVALLFGTCVRR